MNAEHAFFQSRQESLSRHQGLVRIQSKLGLSSYPERIECIDISLFQGGEPVGSLVCFKGGVPDRTHYRHFKIKEVSGTDDFAMMREVVERRLRRGIQDGELPDLLVVDGGKGQLNVATAVAQDLGIDSLQIIGLAKSRVKNTAEHLSTTSERVFLSHVKNPIVLKSHTDEYRLLTHLRDEAHRFAITFHRKLRRSKSLRGVLADLPGIGQNKQRALLKYFGGRQALERASIDELKRVDGIGPKLAQDIFDFLH